MTLPASPPITLGQVYTEFGAPTGTALGAFLRGGAWVPNTPTNSGVPTALPISLGQLCGASATVPLSASASPTSVVGTRATSGSCVSASSTCTASGGSGTKTYSWTRVSGDTTTSATTPTAATTTFQATVSNIAPSKLSVWHCTVTDTSGSATTGNVSVDLEYTGP